MDKALPGVAAPGRPFLVRFEQFNRSICTVAEAVALAAIVFMVVLTCVDVVGAKFFLRPVPGSLDMMMMAQLVGVAFGGAATLIEGRHIAVDFFVLLMPERPRAALASAVHLASFALFAIVSWRLFAHGADLQAGHEVTATAAIPVAPFAYAAALAMVPLCLVLAHAFLQSVEAFRNEP
jgi:TRAP-type C4-dicarboxylate transport system permease small subunit